MNSEKVSRKEVLPGFIAIITLAVIVYIAMELSAEKIADNQFIYSFGDLIGMNIEGGPDGKISLVFDRLNGRLLYGIRIGNNFYVYRCSVHRYFREEKISYGRDRRRR